MIKNRRTAIDKSIEGMNQQFDFRIVKPVVMADSPEVIELYFTDRKQALEGSLTQLTLADNAREIAEICREICKIKKELIRLSFGKKLKP